MPWNDFLAGDQVGSLDPLNILQSITGSAVPQNAVGMPSAAPTIPNVPRSAIPAKPMLPGPAVSAVQPGGSADWKALLEQIGPLLAGSLVGNQASRTGFMSGYMNGHGLAQEERQKREAAQQQKNQASANFRLEVGQHAMAIDDPVQRAQFIDLAESSGVTAGLLKAGDLSALRTVPAGQADAKKRKELTAKIKGLEDAGYKVDTLPPDTTITLDDGSTELLSTAIAEARYRPTSGGAAIPRPDKAAQTAEERYLTKWAKDHGKSVDSLSSAEELQAKTEYANAGKAPTVDPAGPAAQLSSLVAIWKESHPGQEPPANVMTQLRTEANKVNDRPQNFSGMNSLYNDVDPKAIAQAIRNGTHPPDIAQYGRPASAAIASELTKKGPSGEPPFNLARAEREWKAQLKLNNTMNSSQQVRLDESIRSGLAMYDKIDQLAEQWNGQGLGVLSRANLTAAREGARGQKAASLANQLTGAIGQLTSDVATIEQGGLTPTNEARAVAEQSLQAWWGKGTIKDMTAQGRYNMQIRHLARETQTPWTGGSTAPAEPATPAGATPAKTGATPTYQDYLRARGGKK